MDDGTQPKATTKQVGEALEGISKGQEGAICRQQVEVAKDCVMPMVTKWDTPKGHITQTPTRSGRQAIA